MVTLRALECLVAVADAGSTTKAAAVLHMSQPALSHQIAALERELGTAVAVRMKHGLEFTAAGRATVDEARKALEAVERAVEVGRQVRQGHGGQLRIACAETTTWMLVPVLRHWRERRPEVHFDLQEFTDIERMLECLTANGADLVVGPEPGTTTAQRESLGTRETVIATPLEHPLAARPVIARSVEPPTHRNIVAITLTPSDALVRRFIADLKRTRFPQAETADPSGTGHARSLCVHTDTRLNRIADVRRP